MTYHIIHLVYFGSEEIFAIKSCDITDSAVIVTHMNGREESIPKKAIISCHIETEWI